MKTALSQWWGKADFQGGKVFFSGGLLKRQTSFSHTTPAPPPQMLRRFLLPLQ
jgi:hypothetical protein